jgi:general secretion pathway protein M
VSRVTREQAIAVGALALFVMVCAGAVVWSLQVRSDASQDLSDRRDLLSRIEAGARPKAGQRTPTRLETAPANAFLDAATPGLAGAALETYVARLVGQRATLISFAVQSHAGTDAADIVRIEASVDIGLRALQALLYDLESGTPYVFVESMTVRPAAAATQSAVQDGALRVVLVLRALWRPNAL